MTTIKRLEELLAIKDAELEAAQDENARLSRQLEHGVDWMLHEYRKDDRYHLPTPRIEMHLLENTAYYQTNEVALVLKQRDGTFGRVPLGLSKRSGGSFDVTEFPLRSKIAEDVPAGAVAQLPSILNDACFFSEKTGLPAYVVLDKDRIYEITSLRPLVLKTVARA